MGKGFVIFELHRDAEVAFTRHSHGKEVVKVSRGRSFSTHKKTGLRIPMVCGGIMHRTVIVKDVDLFDTEDAVVSYFQQLGFEEYHFLYSDMTRYGTLRLIYIFKKLRL